MRLRESAEFPTEVKESWPCLPGAPGSPQNIQKMAARSSYPASSRGWPPMLAMALAGSTGQPDLLDVLGAAGLCCC